MKCASAQIKRIAFAAFFIFFLGLSYLLQNASGKLYMGMTAPSFTLSDIDGKSQTLNNLSKEKELTVIVFWSTWNNQSFDELKALQELFVHYQSEAFQVIAINVEDQTISNDQVQLIADYCNEIGVTFPVLIDQGLQQFNHYAIKAVPTTFLINRKRTIIDKLAGYPISRRNQLASAIKDIIQPASEKGTSEQKHFTRTEEKAQRYYQMAKVLRKKDDLSSAAGSLRQSIALDDDFYAAYNLLAITLYEDGKREEAVKTFNEIASKTSDDPLLQLDYGNFLIRIGDDEKGLTIIRQVLKEDKSYARGHYYLGEYLFKAGEQGEALKEAQKAAELNPLDYDSQRLLGDIYAFQGKKDLSLAAYKKAATLLEHKVKGNDLILSLCY
jgi:Flp pilus assembly protein TadD